ncbi:MAG TPA: hypothetical protein VFV17_07800, partial [Usitatibacteraceae bacterium]|nr:hypothetical protein [Usitatibacteraceae bacterium]
MFRITRLSLAAMALVFFSSHASAAICQFNQTTGAWNVPANWNNCSTGNGVPAGTPGPADRAEITAATVTLPAGVFQVGDVYLGNSVIQGVGTPATQLDIVAGGTIAWASGTHTFNNLKVTFSAVPPIPATSGPKFINDAEFVVNAGTIMQVGAVNVTGTQGKLVIDGTLQISGNLNMTGGASATISNALAHLITTGSLIVSGALANNGNIFVSSGDVLTFATAPQYTNPLGSSALCGLGTVAAVGQVLTVEGSICGNLIFNVGTLVVGSSQPSFLDAGSPDIGGLAINGNLVLGPNATVFSQIAKDISAVLVDQVNVTGSVTIDPGATAEFIISDIGNGIYAPVTNDVFIFLTAGSLTGTFGNRITPPGFNYSINYNPVSATLVVGTQIASVNNTSDSGPGSLRQAILDANTCDFPGNITFDLGPAGGTISPTTPLPPITCAGTVVNGYSHPGSSPNTSPTDWNANLKVTLDGSLCGGCTGLQLNAAGLDVKGINFTNWPAQAVGMTANSGNSTVRGNYFFQNTVGVATGGASGVKIGELPNAEDRNVIVHSVNAGVQINGDTNASVSNNLIGLGAGGTTGPNTIGVFNNSATNTIVKKNIIAHNSKGLVVNAGQNVDYRESRFYLNPVIAVDLLNDGPTANDAGTPPYDTDTGPNGLLNFPIIGTITPLSAGVVSVNYQIKSTPNSQIDAYFCVNPPGESQCRILDPIGSGLTTDASGLASGTRSLSPVNAGDV